MKQFHESIWDDEMWVECLGESQIYKQFFRITVEAVKSVDSPPLRLFVVTVRVHTSNAVLRSFIASASEMAFAAGRCYVDELVATPSVMTTLKRLAPGE